MDVITSQNLPQPRKLEMTSGQLPVRVLSEEQERVGTAAAFSRLVYLDYMACRAALEAMGSTQCRLICDDIDSTVGFAFVLRDRAWIVFRGSNDLNDWARNLMFVPFYHLGFQRCLADVRSELGEWVEQVAASGARFCLTGHSLGGALASLAADELARNGRPIEALITFGAPRSLSPRKARRFDVRSANLPESPEARLGEVTHRFRNAGEAVTQVPPFLLGFRHLGRLRDRADFAPPTPLPGVIPSVMASLRIDPAGSGTRLENALDAAGRMNLGGFEVVIKALRWGIGRAAYHNIRLYGDSVDSGAAIALDWATLEKAVAGKPSRTRPATYTIFAVVLLVVLALVGTLAWAFSAMLGQAALPLFIFAVIAVIGAYATSDR